MCIFNKKRFFSILISPLLFNGFIFGMELRSGADYARQMLLLRHKENARDILEKLNINEGDYEVVGYGAYSFVIKLKNNYKFVWKFTYSNIENNTDDKQIEYFHPRKTSFKLKGEKNNNICNIINFKNKKIIKKDKKYNGNNPNQQYDLAIQMQYVKGDTLGKYIKQRKEEHKQYTISELYNLIYCICNVLEEFRNKGLIYSDIKEENIMINKDEDGNMDFTIIDVDSATTPKVTRKNSIEGATDGEKKNMDLVKLVEMALRIVRGNEDESQKYQSEDNNNNIESIVEDLEPVYLFDLLDFQGNDIATTVENLEDINQKIKNGKIKNPSDLRANLLS